ncbi:hypothetical protein CBER1_11469 [Cercospora berteroae]|uniref:Transcriptional coactivator p15 (PC4) C-terminal domain-containing protein n=1 Tax=Cercospora berteroae TaxID=357750 RepID=A0A2S6CE23_9PEZI|nr:hypothetical protein CBER1_11469 [Cercospora berteroae]
MSGIYHSYFDTVSTTRKSSPTKRPSPAKKQQDPPTKLSKAFTRQLEKTLSTTTSTKKRKGGAARKGSAKRKRVPTSAKMPKRPAAPEETYDSDGGFVEDAEPKSKKSKHSASSTSKTSKKTAGAGSSVPATMEKDKDGGVYWAIANKRRVQLTEFKGTLMVGIREFYEKDGEMLPGKKGISMTLEQFDAVLGVLPELEREVKKRGGKVRRVRVEGEKDGEEDEGDGGVEKEEKEVEVNEEEEEEEELPKKTKNKLEKFKHKAKNHEATSDEDDD